MPGDRQRSALAWSSSFADNLMLKASDRPPLPAHGFLNFARLKEWWMRRSSEYDMRCTGTEQVVRTLSGGNQQKLVLARELRAAPRLIVAEQPTHGLDVRQRTPSIRCSWNSAAGAARSS